jgi:hypothetical protein
MILKPLKEDDSDIKDLSKEIQQVGKDYASVRAKLDNAIVVYDQVVRWGKKVL